MHLGCGTVRGHHPQQSFTADSAFSLIICQFEFSVSDGSISGGCIYPGCSCPGVYPFLPGFLFVIILVELGDSLCFCEHNWLGPHWWKKQVLNRC